jgi:hypothetical protein
MKHLEIREIEIPSPIENLKVGDDFFYNGQYKDGYEEGISKIKRFYKEVPFWDGVERKVRKNEGGVHSVWMELENLKIVLLGYLEYKDKFRLSDSFVLKFLNKNVD